MSNLANDPDEHLSINIPRSANEYLDFAKKNHGFSKTIVVAKGIAFFKWFLNNGDLASWRENVLPRELLKAVRADMVKKGAKPDQLVNLDKAIADYDEVLRKMETEGEK